MKGTSKIKKIIIVLMVCFVCKASAQVSINTDGSEPDASAMLDVKSNNSGFLPPRMTLTQRNAIASPAEGLIIFNTTTGCLEIYYNSDWLQLCGDSGSPIADYSIGSGGSCSNTVVNGVYTQTVELDTANTVSLDVAVSTVGDYSISTNTINGYSFSSSGTFASTGTITVTLQGSGTPLSVQTDNFTVTANGLGGTCTFSVNVEAVPACGTAISFAGQSYNTIEIGSQCWMKENLNIGDYNPSPTNNGIIEKYCYQTQSSNCDTYGGLYTWDEMMSYVITEGARGICPAGWHIPTDSEWTILTDYLGGLSDAGGKLKETGTTHWLDPNTGATNSSAFTALGSGYSDGWATDIYRYTFYWTSTKPSAGSNYAYTIRLSYNSASAVRDDYYLYNPYLFSVRCLRD